LIKRNEKGKRTKANTGLLGWGWRWFCILEAERKARAEKRRRQANEAQSRFS
jgi:hypothetical protein